VPAPPEVLDVGGEVGALEVDHQIEAHHAGSANGDVGVAGEVAVDLDREEQGGDDQVE
jgi:hypothetical protein